MKKRYILMAVTAALVFAVAAGGTLAAQQVESSVLTLNLQAADLDIQWASNTQGTGGSQTKTINLLAEDLMPGDTYTLDAGDENYAVKNSDVAGAMDAYVRVTVTKYWLDNIDAKDRDADASLVTLTCNPDGWTELDWGEGGNPFAGRTKSETQVFYCTKPLAPGESSAELLQELTLDLTAGDEYQNRKIQIDAVADAVQFVTDEAGNPDTELNRQAILSAWGVVAEFNADGTIQQIHN